ncbi:MAG: hypothetical protein HYX72_05210 [Acidobacteria bacterium]|nr:hypothetical protein [Acidobacteriota bacterium]
MAVLIHSVDPDLGTFASLFLTLMYQLAVFWTMDGLADFTTPSQETPRKNTIGDSVSLWAGRFPGVLRLENVNQPAQDRRFEVFGKPAAFVFAQLGGCWITVEGCSAENSQGMRTYQNALRQIRRG